MKQILYLIACLACSMQGAISLTTKYRGLQNNPAYLRMSLIEIAAVRNDFEALSYFKSRSPDQASLIKARAILENQLLIAKEELPWQPPVVNTVLAEVVSEHREKKRKIAELENAIRSLSAAIELDTTH